MATVSGGTTSERFRFIQVYGRELGVRYLCHWLKVSRSGYYAWLQRTESQRAVHDRLLLKRIVRIHQQSWGLYGSPRIHQALQQQGVCIGRKRVERLMRDAGVVGKVTTVYRRIPAMARFYLKHQNLRLQLPVPTRIDQQWVGDLTYIKVGKRWLYLAVVMDVYSRKIVGWSMGQEKTAELTLHALRQALRRRKPKDDLIFHTDRGVEYGAYLIQNELQCRGICSSMNRPGVCTDNAHIESFFHSLKAERIHGEIFKSEHELRMAITEYIDQFYNPKRLHSGIGYLSPIEFERIAA